MAAARDALPPLVSSELSVFSYANVTDPHDTPLGRLIPPPCFEDPIQKPPERKLLALPPRPDEKQMAAYLESELSLDKLKPLLPLLWVRSQNFNSDSSRALHRHVVLRRNIVAVDDIHMHLILGPSTFYMKPLPDVLLSHDIWATYLCPSPRLWFLAAGMLGSYVDRIQRPLDFTLAQEAHLLPTALTWSRWADISRSVLQDFAEHEYMNNHDLWPHRYRVGELLLFLIGVWWKSFNWCPMLFCWFGSPHEHWRVAREKLLDNALQAPWEPYFDDTYSAHRVLVSNLTWLGTLAVFLALALAAMQLGLAVSTLNASAIFQRLCLALATFVICALLSAFAAAIVLYVLAVINRVLRLYGKGGKESASAGYTSNKTQLFSRPLSGTEKC